MPFTCPTRWLVWFVVVAAGFGLLDRRPTLWAQEPKEWANLAGHTAVVSSVAITADGKTLASGSFDTTIKLWDVGTGKETATLRGHRGGVHSVAFTPDGRTLASGSQDDSVKLWDVATGKETATFKHGYHVRRVVFTPDGKTLISAGEGPIKLWDMATLKERAMLYLVMHKANTNLVLSMALTADGRMLCTGHGDGTLKLWDLTTLKEKTTLRVSDKPSERHVPSVAFTADGKTLACGISHGAVKLWDVATGQENASIEAHRARVWGLAISPDGKTLASGGWDGRIKLWDVATLKELANFPAHADRAYALAFTPDGKTLISGGGIQTKRGETKLWDVATMVKSGTLEALDVDTDGDGLADFHEIHKYRTDPTKRDTAGKGVSDGDWQQRREFTYSVRAIIRVMPPYNLKALNDDYQDVRVRAQKKEYAELEVVAYPLNSNAGAIKANPNWKKDYAGMKEYLVPGITTNWDGQMRMDLLRELAKDGIDPDKLTDREVVEQVSRWLFKRSQYRSMFCTFYVGFRDGKPVVLPGTEKMFERDKGDRKWTVQEQLEHELFGKQMFARRTYGTCTSTAVYQTTVLRALGIPTRMILCIPLADGSDTAQIEMIDKGLTNHKVRQVACLGAISGGDNFASHTFCEVFVGGRWRRLNFTTLGQNILEPNYLGLMIHVHTFNDLSEANLAATWGLRYAKAQRDESFPHSNPYRLVEVSDHFGKYAKTPNPPSDNEHKQITIVKAYWPEGKDAPAEIRELKWSKPKGSGRFFVHCEEWLENAGGYLQYKLFMLRSDPTFVLRAKGQPDVSCQISMNFVTLNSRNLRELEIIIPAADYAKMTKGVAYTLHPVNGKKGYEWKVRDGLSVTRE